MSSSLHCHPLGIVQFDLNKKCNYYDQVSTNLGKLNKSLNFKTNLGTKIANTCGNLITLVEDSLK